MSPQYFLQTYVYLQDRNRARTVRFESWPHLIELLELLLTKKPIIILKARQIGVSYLLVAYCLWKARFFENVKILFLSKKEDDAFDLIGRCKFIDDNLPDFIRSPRDPNQRGLIGFSETRSEIQALPSTEDAGRSTDATIVVCDEWEYHPYSEINYAAVKPTISSGGQFVAMSTADGMKDISKSFFKSMYVKAVSGDTNFIHRFYGVFSRPDRTREWLDNEIKDMPLWLAEREYPETEKQALGTLKSRAFFDSAAIDYMYSNITKPIEHELSDKYKGLVKIYKLPVVGAKYCLYTDPSEGKEDPHACIVIDKTGEEVAESHGKTTADQCAQIHDELVRLYNDALNSWESGPGGAGGIMSTKLEELGTPNRCSSLNVTVRPFKLDITQKKKGWWTSKTLWNVLIWELEEAVRLMQIVPRSKECLDEFSQFIVPEGEEPQKSRGGHDDYIDAFARVWHLKKYLSTGEIRVTSGKYRTDW